MVGATFKDMCYMHGPCFAMLTPMLYISVCRKICGVIRGKGFAHSPMVSSIALDYVYRTYSACGKVYGATHKPTINFPIFIVRVGRRFEGVSMRPCEDPSERIVCKWSQAIVL